MTHQDPGLGRNRTGMQMSPLLSKEMMQNLNTFPWDAQTMSVEDPEKLEMDYLQTAHPIGSIPVPLTLKGMAMSGIDKLKGARPEIFIDKLGERMAFERQGVRLYEALLRKCSAGSSSPAPVPVERLELIRQNELEHMFLIKATLENFGADPTAQTPSADVVAVASMGLLQVITDPRTSIRHSIEAIQVAELTDRDGWNLLIELADALGEDKLIAPFQKALQEEDQHVHEVRTWLKNLTLMEAGVSAAATF